MSKPMNKVVKICCSAISCAVNSGCHWIPKIGAAKAEVSMASRYRQGPLRSLGKSFATSLMALMVKRIHLIGGS